MKEILNEWKKYLAEQADGTDQREISGKTDAERKFLEFGKQLTTEKYRQAKYRQALQNFEIYAPKDDDYSFVRSDLEMILRAAMNPEKTNPGLLNKIAIELDKKIFKLVSSWDEKEKAMERYIDLVKEYGKNRFDSLDVATIVLLDAGAGDVYL